MSVASFRGPPRAQAGSVAERVGFEPTVRFPPHTLSKRAPSATRTPLRGKRVLWLTESAGVIDRRVCGGNAAQGGQDRAGTTSGRGQITKKSMPFLPPEPRAPSFPSPPPAAFVFPPLAFN